MLYCPTQKALQGFIAMLVILLVSSPLAARSLQVSEDQLTQVEVLTLLLSQEGTPVVLLQQQQQPEMIPIFIGAQEARAISDALREDFSPRPMTHDLLSQLLLRLEVQLKRILIDRVQQGSYLAFLELQDEEKTSQLVDARPSDALALALRLGAPIYVGPEVLATAALVEHPALEDQLVRAAGISVTQANQELRAALELPDQPGVLVTQAQGVAEQKGMLPGAFILKVNDQALQTTMEYLRLVRQTPKNQATLITYWQQGQTHQLELPSQLSSRVSQTRPQPQPEPSL